MRKKILLFGLIFIFLLILCFVIPYFYQNIGDYKYKIENGKVTILKYNGTGIVEIPERIYFFPVTSIGNGAFYSSQLTSVKIPNSVISIGEYAFSFNQLTDITIPDSVISIGDCAFEKNELTRAVIGNSVTSIGSCAFWKNKLTNVTIGNSVVSIGNSAFRDNELRGITIPDSVISIRTGAFYQNRLSSAAIGNSVTSIGDWAFAENVIGSITIPYSVISIGAEAFDENYTLHRVIVLNPNTSFRYHAFGKNERDLGYLLFEPNDSNNFADKTQAHIYLDNLANDIKNRDLINRTVHVYGYTAFVQNGVDSLALSRDRAIFVIKELEKRGVSSSLFSAPNAIGPVSRWGDNSDEENRKQNRRVRIVIDPAVVRGNNR